MDAINYNGQFIENSNDFERIILTLFYENLDDRADDVGAEVSSLIRAALAMARQEVLMGVIAKAEHVANNQQHYIDNIK